MRALLSGRIVLIASVAVILAASIACEPSERDIRESKSSVPMEGITVGDVRIRPGAGEVDVRGGDIDGLMEGTFRYNRRHWEPRVDFQKIGDRGRLVVERRRSRTFLLGRIRNDWNIILSTRIPLDLDLDFGAGEARLDLRGLDVRRLTIDMGVGDLTLDLSGARAENLEASIDGGVGHATVYLPSEVGVRVRIDGGLGSIDAPGFTKDGHVFSNEAHGRTKTVIDLEIDAGIGSIDLKLRDNQTSRF